jgi:beta-glucanase (GH16 family)
MARTRDPHAAATAAAVCSWGQPAFTHQPPAPPPPPPPPPPQVYTFEDEFAGAAGASPDPSKWLWDVGPGSQIGGNNETEQYTNDRSTSYLDGNGHLVIAAISVGGAFHSARMKSNFHQLYGHWEASIAVPNVPGCWPAFWFMGQGSWPQCGECDVMECYGTGFTDGTIWNTSATANKNGVSSHQLDGGFHTYHMDWAEGSIKLYFDGVLYDSATSSNLTPWPFDTNGGSYCLLNIATNGTGTNSVNPNPALLPAKMVVDYVRCWT